jgi:hypothetical protein
MRVCLPPEAVTGDSQRGFYTLQWQSDLSCPAVHMVGEVIESFVQAQEDFSHQMTTDMRLMSGFDPHLDAGGLHKFTSESWVPSICSLTAIFQPPDHMSELIVLILSVIEELIDFALVITAFPHGLPADVH